MKTTKQAILMVWLIVVGLWSDAVYGDFRTDRISEAIAAQIEAGLDAYKIGDYATALKQWKPLAEQGHAKAQSALGRLHNNGNGVIQDYEEALKWYRLASEQGYAQAQHAIGWLYANGKGVIRDYVKAHMWWNISASLGYKKAAEDRTRVEKRMVYEQIKEAQKMARECVERNYKGC